MCHFDFTLLLMLPEDLGFASSRIDVSERNEGIDTPPKSLWWIVDLRVIHIKSLRMNMSLMCIYKGLHS